VDVDASGLDVELGVAITMVDADAVTIVTSWRGRGSGAAPSWWMGPGRCRSSKSRFGLGSAVPGDHAAGRGQSSTQRGQRRGSRQRKERGRHGLATGLVVGDGVAVVGDGVVVARQRHSAWDEDEERKAALGLGSTERLRCRRDGNKAEAEHDITEALLGAVALGRVGEGRVAALGGEAGRRRRWGEPRDGRRCSRLL